MASRGRTTRARRKTQRKTRRRSTVKTRRSAKKVMKRTSTKRILNITSRKKRDTMLAFTNTTNTGAISSSGPVAGPAYANGANPYTAFIWCATARGLVQFSGGSNTIVQEASRTATTCYMRGLSEHVRIQTSSGLPWIWRRIAFKAKNNIFSVADPTDTGSGPTGYRTNLETSNGYQRLFWQMTGTPSSTPNLGSFNAVVDILFKGAQGIDFVDFTLAHVDTRRVDLAYDKTVRVSSGNASGVLREYKRWHPMNKNLVYNDDEQGEVQTTQGFSVKDKQGMGDYYIIDFFTPGTGSSGSDILQLSANSTLYWHEK